MRACASISIENRSQVGAMLGTQDVVFSRLKWGENG
jgi:hypothetical protein